MIKIKKETTISVDGEITCRYEISIVGDKTILFLKCKNPELEDMYAAFISHHEKIEIDGISYLNVEL